MACFHPLVRVPIGYDAEGKEVFQILPYAEGYKELDCQVIPCGRCIGCRLEYSRQWANRMMMELQYHDSAYFVTLTYDNDYIPRRPVSDRLTGEYLCDSYSLRKKDVSKFIKHVRKHFPDQEIRFYAAGEYGTKTIRPHYHLILFGLKLDDLEIYKRTPQGDVLYNSKSLSDCWANYVGKRSDGSKIYDPLGHVVIAPVTWETCAYVARYVTKKMSGPLAIYFEEQNMEQPFSLMSRKPGIGKKWYDDHPGCMDYEFINVSTAKKALKFRPPKYFEHLYEVDYPEMANDRKEERLRIVKEAHDLLIKNLDKPYLEYLADKESLLKDRLKVLDRVQI